MPRSLTQFVLKLHGRCDLACDHCYVYEHADQSWRAKAFPMSPSTLRVAARRIAEHARSHELPLVHVVLHGGEPLLVGVDAMRGLLTELRATIEAVTALDLRMQTNGVLLSPAWCDLFVEYGVTVGVSLDGDRAANDRHRRFGHGGSSHEQVLRALELLRRPAYRGSFAGILCTIDVANDPVGVYEALVAQQPPRIDLLLPHATWENPPYRPAGEPTPYARWLDTVFRRWTADGRPVPIRIFDSLLSVAAGGPSGTESLGLDPADLVVIETDGAYEQADSTKVAFPGAPATGLNVFAHTIDAVAAFGPVAARQAGFSSLCRTCQQCPVVRECGGGLYAHRYGSGGFDNPSVYCADLKELVVSIKNQQPASPREPSPPDATPLDVLELLDEIGAGAGSAAAMDFLADTQLSFTRSLVVAAAQSRIGLQSTSWPVLTWLDQAAPAAVRAVLCHPYARVWAVAALGLTSPVAADAGYLSWLAAAAAIRSGLDFDLEVPLREGRLHLPTLGSVELGVAAASARVRTRAGGFTVEADGQSRHVPRELTPTWPEPAGEAPQWWRPTRVVAQAGLRMTIEDGDPYRDCHQYPAVGPLTPDSADKWRAVLEEAWSIVQAEVPDQVPSLRRALRAVTPLQPDQADRLRSATARQAFGSVGIAYTADAAALAAMLVHEVQHNKLGALLDLCDLFDRGATATVKVGWRPDLRPVEGALQGTYAHLALADIWRVRAARSAPHRGEAVAVFRMYRDWTVDALTALPATGTLTAAGRRFVARMASTVAGWPQ